MSRLYTFDVGFNKPEGLEIRLAEYFLERKKGKKAFGDIISIDDTLIAKVSEHYYGSYAGSGGRTYSKDVEIREFDRRLDNFLEGTGVTPKEDINLVFRDILEYRYSNSRSMFIDLSIKRTYEINENLFVTYKFAFKGGKTCSLEVRISFGYNNKIPIELENIFQKAG